MSTVFSSRERFGMLFVGVARRWRATLDAKLSNVGLSDATWSPLVHIGRSGGGISQKELAHRIGIDGSTLVRLLDILVDKKLIERRQDQTDRRANLLFLTQTGTDLVADIQEKLNRFEGQMLADLDDDALDMLTENIGRIDARIKAMREEEDRKE